MSTLYRKYRPQNFTEVVGQNHIKITLEQEIKSGRLAHAYLFCGPRAVGKTTLARVLAKALNCEKRKPAAAEPCNDCPSCREITEGRALDIIEIDAASHTGVDNVRDNIIASARVAPSRSKYKVFIIDEVHMLSVSAFNALLKLIEEPPAAVIFVLCTTEVHKVPATIISRCQRFDFKRISLSEVVKKLTYIIQTENIKVEREILETIARHADGHMRDAESLLGQIAAMGGDKITRAEADLVIPRSDLNEVINLIGCLIKKDAAGGIRLVNQLMDDGFELKTLVLDTIEILRKLLLIKISPGMLNKLALELGETIELKISQLAGNLTAEQLLKLLEKFIKAGAEVKTDFMPQLPLEMAIVEICSMTDGHLMSLRAPSVQTAPVKPAGQAKNINLTDEQILEKWNEVLAKVKQFNHSLSFILRVCQPRGLNGSELRLAFKYKFHKDRVSEPAIKNVIEKVLEQVYGASLTVEAEINENLEVAASKLVSDEPVDLKKSAAEPAPGDQGKVIDNLLKTFGGKVVG